jgi:hypothetical protein
MAVKKGTKRCPICMKIKSRKDFCMQYRVRSLACCRDCYVEAKYGVKVILERIKKCEGFENES